MKKAVYVLIALIIFSSLLAGLLWFKNITLSPQGASSNSEKCNIISYGAEDAFNILFFSQREPAEKYAETLFSIYPFNINKDKFNIFYVDDYHPICDLFGGVAILCYSENIMRKASSCPSDYVVIITDDFDKRIRSSTYMNVISINQKQAESVFVHEFGREKQTGVLKVAGTLLISDQ
jgi:hypothetical protein